MIDLNIYLTEFAITKHDILHCPIITCHQSYIENVVNRLCFYTNNYFHSCPHLRNFEIYYSVRSFSACYIRTSCSDSKKYFVLYYYNYCNPVPNKYLRETDKHSRCEMYPFLLSNRLLFLYYH